MQKLLEGRVAVVTGAGRGIGREIALLMAQNGARLVINDLGATVGGEGTEAGPANAVVDEIVAAGGEAAASTDSVTEEPSAGRIVQCALDRFGRIDIVVNNAGILRDRIFHQMTAVEWDDVIRVHLNGSFHVSAAAARHFRVQSSGVFVHMTSTSGLIGNLAQANYAAAKMGIAGLSRSIAIDMARYGVRSNCISPAAFTRMTDALPAGTPEEQAAFSELLRTKVRPEQNAPLAVFLASDAASELSGQIIGVRGNEIYLYSQPRPIRTLHRGDGWTPQALAEQLVPAWRSSLTPLERIRDVFSWEPI